MEAYVYETTNLVNGKKYIGVHKSKKFDTSYKGSGKLIHRAIKKYGWDNFECHIVREFDSFSEALDYEEYLIDELNAVDNPQYYNLVRGGGNLDNITGKYCWVFRDDETHVKILKTELKEYLDKGYSLGSGDSSFLGRVRMNNGDKEIFIPNDCVNEKLEEGYSFGLLHSYKYVNKDGEIFRVHSEDYEDYLIHGYHPGVPKRVCVNDGEHIFRITSDKVDSYLEKGYSLGSLQKSTLGRVSVTNGETTKFILSEDLSEWEDKGFQKGTTSSGNRDHVFVTKDGETHSIPKDDLDTWISKGFERGAYHPNQAGQVWMYKGDKQIRIHLENVKEYESDGWSRGFIRKQDGWKWVTNGLENHFVNPEEARKYIDNGFKYGMTRKCKMVSKE